MDTLSIASSGLAWPEAFAARGLDPATLGTAYLFALANIVITAGAFFACRSFLIVTPNGPPGITVCMALWR